MNTSVSSRNTFITPHWLVKEMAYWLRRDVIASFGDYGVKAARMREDVENWNHDALTVDLGPHLWWDYLPVDDVSDFLRLWGPALSKAAK